MSKVYKRTQDGIDKKRGIFRVYGIGFEDGADDEKIKYVIEDVFSADVIAPALMTREAICKYCDAPEYVLKRMEKMTVGTSFVYDGCKITRWSTLTYNAFIMSR